MSAVRLLSSGLVTAIALSAVAAAIHPAWAQQAVPQDTSAARRGVLGVPGQRTPAQEAAAMLGRDVSNADIVEAIRRSGMSEAQVRARLQQSGYDPRLADPYYSGEVPADKRASGNAAFVDALRSIGLLDPVTEQASNQDEIDLSTRALPPSKTKRSTGKHDAVTVFGKDIFSANSLAFEPPVAGTVDAGYRLGAGDQLQIVMTGQVENAYQVDVRRDGSVILPTVGQVSLAGLSLEGARAAVRRYASRVYSGIDEGKINVDVTVSRIRTNVVYVIGEVERPGAHQVSALGTVFLALSRAGGPTERGSFRNIEVRRGGQVVRTLDVYDYLLRGDATNDIRTEQGDIIFVPLNTRAITFDGEFRRPAIYELRPAEGFAQALSFAGGMLPTASTERVQIDRILPAPERTPGRERVLIDVNLRGKLAVLDSVTLNDNDVVTSFPIGDLRRNYVAVTGQVFQPGQFEWQDGMTLGDALAKAQGTMPWALTDRVKIDRALLNSGRTETYSLNLQDPTSKTFRLFEFDSITVLDGRVAFPPGTVIIAGAVNRPGSKPYTERQTLQDRIDVAGGFKEDAAFVEVARRRVGATYNDTTTIVYTFPISQDRTIPDSARHFVLARYDQIFVRSSPGYRNNGTVTLVGQFAHPGTYTIERDGETVSDIIRRAGGILPRAFPGGFRLTRDGRPVAIDYDKAMKHDSRNDIAVIAGDELRIETRPALVYVTGEVGRQVAIPYDQGWKLDRYIQAAGGLSPDADDGRIIVAYESGAVDHSKRFHSPTIQPGATIMVGKKDTANQTDWSRIASSSFQVATTLVSLVIGILAVKK